MNKIILYVLLLSSFVSLISQASNNTNYLMASVSQGGESSGGDRKSVV